MRLKWKPSNQPHTVIQTNGKTKTSHVSKHIWCSRSLKHLFSLRAKRNTGQRGSFLYLSDKSLLLNTLECCILEEVVPHCTPRTMLKQAWWFFEAKKRKSNEEICMEIQKMLFDFYLIVLYGYTLLDIDHHIKLWRWNYLSKL